MKKFSIVLNFFLIKLFLSNVLYAQPYKYYFTGEWNNRSISRINLQSGVIEEVIPDCYIGLQLFTTPDQQKIIYTDRSQIYAFDINNLNNKIVIMSKTRGDEILQILDAPKANKLFLVFGDVDQTPYMTIVFDRETFTRVDTLYEVYSYSKPFLSENETNFFRLLPHKQGIFFKVIDLNGHVLNESQRCGNLTDFHFITGIRDSEDGKALIVFSNGEDYQNRYYLVCDPEQTTHFAPISFPWRSEAYLSPDAKNIIIEDVQFIQDDDPNTPGIYRPGNVYVFDSKTGLLKQRLKLPPQGEILLFDHYPDNLFYFCSETPQEPMSTDISYEQSDTELISMIFNDLQDSYNNGWILDQITVEKYQNLLILLQTYVEQNEKQLVDSLIQHLFDEITEDTGSHLTSEGHLMIYNNLIYLEGKILHSEVSIEDLIIYIQQAQSEGTIDNVGIANSLISKLETAQKQLEKEKPKQAANALNAFLNELETQHEKHIAEEVYTYLKEKVEGLIAQLEE